jgi:hypothetical protein
MGPLSQSTLVIVESGAGAPGMAGRVLSQAEGEALSGFLGRVRTAVAESTSLQRVVLVAGPVHDFARIAARADIARTAAQSVASGGGGSLVLAASDVRGELAQRALGEILREQLGSSVRVSIAELDATSIAA